MRDFLLNFFLSFLFPSLLFSQNSTQKVGQVEATLLAEPASIAPEKSFTVAIRLRMDPEWHTYWKNSGDSGFATQIEWELPEGFQAGEIQWPYPERVVVGGIVSYAFHNEAWLLTQISTPKKLPPTLVIKAKVSWLMCKEICIPGEATLSLTLPPGGREIKLENEALFEAAREKLPSTVDKLNPQAHWLSSNRISFQINFKNEDLIISNAYFFSDDANQIVHERPQIFTQLAPGRYEVKLEKSSTAPSDWNSLSGVLVYQNAQQETKAFQIKIPIEVQSRNMEQITEKEGWHYLFYAFLGGLILNLMPCVLPVISLKIFSFIRQSQEDSRKIFQHGLIFSTGIILSFLLLAMTLILLRLGGEKIGWGFQFQSPLFLIVLSSVVLVMSLALFNVFIVGSSLTSVGGTLAAQGGLRGSFFNGVLATTLATPCTAPFMGTALGFALTQSPIVALAIFGALGVGMAFPYLLLSAQPKLLKYLPKPGAWMEIFKQFTGFLMFGTLLWLLWLFGTTQGIDSLLLLSVFLLVLSLSCWLIGQFATPVKTRRSKMITWLLSLFLIATAGHFFIKPTLSVKKTTQTSSKINWQPYSKSVLEKSLQTTQPVFVDFTADWCLSCKVNERIALNISQTQALFENHQVIALKADWTTRNPEVTEALTAYGRAGVPFYLFYPADRSQPPVILPELLTPAIIVDLFTEN